MKVIKYSMLLLFVFLTQSNYAATYRFDFSGQTYTQASSSDEPVFTGNYEGYFLIDSTVQNTSEIPIISSFVNSVIDGSVTIDGNQFGLVEGGFNRTGVSNNAGEDFDSFAAVADMIDQNGRTGLFAIQLIDTSNLLFDDTQFPSTPLTLDDFNLFDHGNFTGSLAILFDGPGSISMNVEYAYLRPVPVPGALILFGSALLAVCRKSAVTELAIWR